MQVHCWSSCIWVVLLIHSLDPIDRPMSPVQAKGTTDTPCVSTNDDTTGSTCQKLMGHRSALTLMRCTVWWVYVRTGRSLKTRISEHNKQCPWWCKKCHWRKTSWTICSNSSSKVMQVEREKDQKVGANWVPKDVQHGLRVFPGPVWNSLVSH